MRAISAISMKKGGSFQQERFSFLLKSSMGGGLTPETPPPRAYVTVYISISGS